jgi:outer membrane protein
MKTSFKSMLAFAAFGASALLSQAQTAPKILVVDIGKVFQSHYKTAEQDEKMKAMQQKAEQDLGALNKEVNDLVAKYRESDEQSKNPAITKDAQAKAQAETEKIGQTIQGKQQEAQAFVMNTRRTLGELQQNFQNLMLEEITKIATDIAKKKGATLLLPKGTIVYSDASYEITDDVLAEINRTKPASVAAPVAAPAPAAKPAAAPATDAAPTVTFPGAKK